MAFRQEEMEEEVAMGAPPEAEADDRPHLPGRLPWYRPDWDMSVATVGMAPAVAMANLYLGTSAALIHAAQNATQVQQSTNVTAQTATAIGVDYLYSAPWRWWPRPVFFL